MKSKTRLFHLSTFEKLLFSTCIIFNISIIFIYFFLIPSIIQQTVQEFQPKIKLVNFNVQRFTKYVLECTEPTLTDFDPAKHSLPTTFTPLLMTTITLTQTVFESMILDLVATIPNPIKASLPFPFSLVQAGIGETRVTVQDKHENEVAHTVIPALSFYINDDIYVNYSSLDIQFNQNNLKNLISALKPTSLMNNNNDDLEEFIINLKLFAPLNVGSATIYPELTIGKSLKFGKFQTRLKSLVEILERISNSLTWDSFNMDTSSLEEYQSRHRNRQRRGSNQLSNIIGLFDSVHVIWANCSEISPTYFGSSNTTREQGQTGFGTRLDFELENGTPLTFAIPRIAFDIELQRSKLARITFDPFSVSKGLQQFTFDFDLLFEQGINLKSTLEAAFSSLALNKDVVVSIAGPVISDDASFMQEITRDLRFDVPLSDLLTLSPALTFYLKSTALNTIANSTFGLVIDENSLTIPMNLVFPFQFAPFITSSLYTFDYNMKLAVSSSSETTLFQMNLYPLVFDGIGSTLSTKLQLLFVNTDAAALELAKLVDGVFENNAFVKVRDFSLASEGRSESDISVFKGDFLELELGSWIEYFFAFVDTSELLGYVLSRVKPSLQSVSIKEKGDTLVLGGNIVYNNDLNLYGGIKPLISFQVDFQNGDHMKVIAKGFWIDLESGVLKPEIQIEFLPKEKEFIAFSEAVLYLLDPHNKPLPLVRVSGIELGENHGIFEKMQLVLGKGIFDVAISIWEKSDINVSNLLNAWSLLPRDLLVEFEKDLPKVALVGLIDFKSPFKVELDLPSIRFTPVIGQTRAANIEIRVQKPASSSGSKVFGNVAFLESVELANNLESAVDKVVAKSYDALSLGIADFGFGRVKLISQVNFSASVFRSYLEGAGLKFHISDILDSAGLTFGSLDIEATVNRILKVSSRVNFENPFPITVKGLEYVSFDVGVDGGKFVEATISLGGLIVSPGTNKAQPLVKVHFPQCSKETKLKIKGLVSNLMTTSLDISGVRLGKLQFLSGIKAQLTGTNSIINPDIIEQLVRGMKVDGLGLAVNFKESNVIKVGAKGFLDIGLDLLLSIPFVKIDTLLDSHPSFDASIQNLKLSRDGKRQPVSIEVSLSPHDTDELATSINNIFEKIMKDESVPGVIIGHSILFGFSETDIIDSFSEIDLKFGLSSILKPLIETLAISKDGYFDSLGIELNALDISASAGRSLIASIDSILEIRIPISISGLGFFKFVAGVDAVNVAVVSGTFPDVSKGKNTFKLDPRLEFPSSTAAQSKVALLAKEILDNGVGETKEDFIGHSLQFGASPKSAFNFLSKISLRVRSTLFLNHDLVNYLRTFGLVPGGSILDPIAFKKIEIGSLLTTASQSLQMQLNLLLKKAIPFRLTLSGVGVNILLNHKVYVYDLYFTISLIAAHSQVSISASNVEIRPDVWLSNDNSLQQDIKMAAAAAYEEKPLPGDLNFSGFTFGVSKNDYVDTFSTISLDSWTLDQTYRMLGLQAMKYPNIYDLTPLGLKLDAVNQNTLICNVDLTVDKLPFDIGLDLSFLGFEILLDSTQFMDISFDSLVLKGSRILGSIFVKFPNPSLYNQNILIGWVTDLLFHRSAGRLYKHNVGFRGLTLGPAREGAILIASQVGGSVDFDEYARDAAHYFDKVLPVEFANIGAALMFPGIEVNIALQKLPFPLTINLEKIIIDIGWQMNGTGKMYRALGVSLDAFQPQGFHVMAIPDLSDPATGVFEPLVDLLINMFQFKDFVGNSRFLNLKLIGRNGAVFTPFYDAIFNSPPVFAIPDPLYVKLLPYQIPLKIAIAARNPTSLTLDLGRAKINVTDADSHPVLCADSVTDVIARNMFNGGNGTVEKAPRVALLEVPVFELGGIAVDLFFSKIFGKDLGYTIDVRFLRDDVELMWLSKGVAYILEYGLDRFGSVLGSALNHVKLSIGKDENEKYSNSSLSQVFKTHGDVSKFVDFFDTILS